MKTIMLRNNSGQTLRIMLEPWAEVYDVPVEKEVKIQCELKEDEIDFEIDVERDNFLGLWVPDGTKVSIDGQAMKRVLGDDLG